MQHLRTQLKEEGFCILPLLTQDFIRECQKIIDGELDQDVAMLSKLDRQLFHGLIESCQAKINTSKALEKFIIAHDKALRSLLEIEDELSWVSVMKLRSIRPSKLLEDGVQDHVPMHRESLYSPYPSQIVDQYNCWIPLTSAATSSGIYCIPGSHKIKDQDLIIEEQPNHPVAVKRYSSGHRIGFPYLPKTVDRSNCVSNAKQYKIEVPLGSMLIFSAMLIHGGGMNKSDEMRMSVDTGFMPSKKVIDNTEIYAANGKKHYLTLSELKSEKN